MRIPAKAICDASKSYKANKSHNARAVQKSHFPLVLTPLGIRIRLFSFSSSPLALTAHENRNRLHVVRLLSCDIRSQRFGRNNILISSVLLYLHGMQCCVIIDALKH